MRSTQPPRSVLWFFTGVMVLIFADACGSALSGAATALAAMAGLPEGVIAVVAITMLCVGFGLGIVAGLRDLAGLAQGRVTTLPPRWIVGSIAVMFVVAPFWRFCVVHVQEPISGSDSVRTIFDHVLYGLVLTSALPVGIGVPWMVARLQRQPHLDSRTAAG
jgi:hypothetical protein